jgi:hypothetical protein
MPEHPAKSVMNRHGLIAVFLTAGIPHRRGGRRKLGTEPTLQLSSVA